MAGVHHVPEDNRVYVFMYVVPSDRDMTRFNPGWHGQCLLTKCHELHSLAFTNSVGKSLKERLCRSFSTVQLIEAVDDDY